MKSLAVMASTILLLSGMPVVAQDAAANYPNKPIKIIVSVPPGGGVDTVTRLIGEKLRQKWGQPVIVENRAGAAGNIGAETVFNAEPDGYTLLASQPAPITINPLLYKKLAFDPADLTAVAIMTQIPNVLLVRKDFPVQDGTKFLEYAKANHGKLNYASQGIGTTSHLSTALFEKLTGTKLVHVPYKGTGPALNDLIASHVDLIFMELASAINLHRNGTARILAVATEKRLPMLPDVPTMEEAGVHGFESGTWNAITAPPKTPPAIVAKLNAAVNEALKSPDVVDHFAHVNLIAAGGSAAEAATFIKSETVRWGEVIKASGIPAN
ncbi:MAG: extracytoplasmic binding receptor [Xanthobacteraceae bacterium]|nr:extracytoplasmic binding receptor [Xanthobacteraceae bacterium]